jgi:hypothetical protein
MTSREALFRYQMLSQLLARRLAGERQAEAVRSGVSRAYHFTPSDLLYDARAPPRQGNVASIVIATLRRTSTLPAKNSP